MYSTKKGRSYLTGGKKDERRKLKKKRELKWQTKSGQAVTLLTCIREVPGSNLDHDIDDPERPFRSFPQCVQANDGILPQVRSRLRPSNSSFNKLPTILQLVACWTSGSQGGDLKSSIFRDITNYSPVKVNRSCGGIHRLLQGDFLLGLLFDSEDGGSMFLRNNGWLSSDYMVSCPRRLNSSVYCLLGLRLYHLGVSNTFPRNVGALLPDYNAAYAR
jgi:hypothetical protein